MSYDPKSELVRNIDGLARRRRYPVWRLAGLGISLVLVISVMIWAGREEGEKKAVQVSPPLTRGERLFRDMSFLMQVRRAPAPDIFLRTLDGQNHSTAQHLGKIVLVNFWATWCQPCVREMPAIERLYRKYGARGLEIVAISLDHGNEDDVRAFAEKLGLTFRIVLDPEHRAKELYRVRGLPTTYLLDRKNQVAGYGIGEREWDNEAANNLIGHLLDEKN